MTTDAILDLYDEYVAGADTWDKGRFDAHLIGSLLVAVGPEVAVAAMQAAAADVNRASA